MHAATTMTRSAPTPITAQAMSDDDRDAGEAPQLAEVR